LVPAAVEKKKKMRKAKLTTLTKRERGDVIKQSEDYKSPLLPTLCHLTYNNDMITSTYEQ